MKMKMKTLQDFARQVRADQVRQLYTRFPLGAFLGFIIASILVIIQWPVTDPPVLLGWWGILALITALRWLSTLLFNRAAAAGKETAHWGTWFFIGATCSGLTWGAAAFLLLPGQDLEHHFFLLAALAAVSAAGTIILAPKFGVALAFLCSLGLPVTLRFFLFNQAAVAGIILLYITVVILIARRTYLLVKDGLLLRIKNTWEEARLRESEERYHSLVENLPIGIYRSTPGPEGRFLTVNSAIVNMFGYDSAGELYRTPVSGLFANPPERKTFSDKLLSRGEVVAEELRLKKKNGEEIWGAVKASVIRGSTDESEYFDGMIEDITERKKTEEALRESENWLKTIMDTVQVGIKVIDAKRHIIADINPVGAEILGVSREQIIGSTCYKNVCPGKNGTCPAADGEGKMHKWEGIVVNAGGKSIPVLKTIAPVKLKGQTYFLESFIDISVQKHNEKELEKAKEAAEAANRAKSEFLANMSHELRTPLNGILGYTQILKKDKNVTPTQVKAFDIIESSGRQLLNMINDILDLSKIEAQKIEIHESNFPFPEFLEEISGMIRFRVRKKAITFNCRAASHLPALVHSDKERLSQILLNLLGNAVKFTDRGSITFKIYPAPFASPPAVRFQVEDTGIGIPGNQLKDLFSPFKKIAGHTRIIEGTGLGLALSRELVRLLGGDLHVKSAVGKGSTFWFDLVLPDVTEGTGAKKTKKPRITGYKGEKRKILLIDDNPINRMILTKLLEPPGFEVTEAEDGREGIDRALKIKPDLIFMDMMMPEMDGFEATRQVRKSPQLEHVKVIIISANVAKSDREQSLAAGCDDFLPLPVQAQELYSKLETLLKLEWIYEATDTDTDTDRDTDADRDFAAPGSREQKSETQNLITPPPPEIKTLYEFAEFGDFKGLHDQLNKIERMDNHYIPFVKQVRSLAGKFQIDEICEFIEEYI